MYLKKVILAILCLSMASASFAAHGYRIRLEMPGVKDGVVYLAHYYGRPLPTIYKRDSTRIVNGIAVFGSMDSTFIGGIYMMLLSDRKTYFEFLLNDGDDIGIAADVKKLPDGVKFTNSPENERFNAYNTFLSGFAARQQSFVKEMAAARTRSDSADVRKRAIAASHELVDYRKNYIKTYPNTLLSAIFSALRTPEVPDGDHYLPDGKTIDSSFNYTYYKAHYWDGFNLRDDRLIHTPLFDTKLEEYFTRLVIPSPDSIEHETDMLLRRADGTQEIYKYILWWVTRYSENSKVMGMDEVFVYLVENYYMKGKAPWLSNEEVKSYFDQAQKIAPNMIGNLAPEVRLPSVTTGQIQSLSAMRGEYTLLIFYAPDCSHCQKEIPQVDSLYRKLLKARGVKVYTVATSGSDKDIKDFINKYGMNEWTNTWDSAHTGDWRAKYDVYSTPALYLLDDRKIIRGKKLDHTSLEGLIDILELKNKQHK
jgi:peroxiredoxin